jgi:hypothetical protein
MLYPFELRARLAIPYRWLGLVQFSFVLHPILAESGPKGGVPAPADQAPLSLLLAVPDD